MVRLVIVRDKSLERPAQLSLRVSRRLVFIKPPRLSAVYSKYNGPESREVGDSVFCCLSRHLIFTVSKGPVVRLYMEDAPVLKPESAPSHTHQLCPYDIQHLVLFSMTLQFVSSFTDDKIP